MGKLLNLVFNEIEIEGYERIVEVIDEECGLHAIIVLHNTTLGPGLGGIRAYPYASFDEALNDAMRLAKGMTYKAAVAKTGTGGGKSVMITDYKGPKSEELLFSFAEAVNYFEGQYICAEDFGMHPVDLGVIRKKTRYAVGLPHPQSSGDPSYFTAFGGFLGAKAVAKKLWGVDSLRGRTVAIQGLGAAGMKLANFLFWDGAKLIVTDIDQEVVNQAVHQFGAKAVSPDEIYTVACDIFAPCALGGILNPNTIPHLQCQAVAGLANNQLLNELDGEALNKRGILYTPDYVINSGGLFNVCAELEKEGYNPFVARNLVDGVYHSLLTIFKLAGEKNIPTNLVANELAEYNLEQEIGKRNKEIVFHH